MSTSPYQPSWDDADFVLLGQDEPVRPAGGSEHAALFESDVSVDSDVLVDSDRVVETVGPDVAAEHPSGLDYDDEVADVDPSYDDHEATWTDAAPVHSGGRRPATEYVTSPGLPSRGVVVATIAATAACVGLDFALTGGLTTFFDLCFVVIGLVGAMAVRRSDLFTAGVLSPLLFAAVVGVIAVAAPTSLADEGAGLSKVFMTGLADHAGALAAAYGVALLTVAGRVLSSRTRR